MASVATIREMEVFEPSEAEAPLRKRVSACLRPMPPALGTVEATGIIQPPRPYPHEA